jgi:P4 family phage/plasmid primase-like protien
MARASNKLDIELIRRAATGRWPEILSHVGGIDPAVLDGRHHPCPKCGGKDRFRLIDEAAGSCLCNQCFSRGNGDGFAVVQWSTGVNFREAAGRIADYLGVDATNFNTGRRFSPKSKGDPAGDLDFRPWNATLVALWCRHKPPITPAAVRELGGRLARYRGQCTVIAIPVWGEHLADSEPVGWCLYNTTGKGLPRKGQDDEVEWIKTKLTYGSKAGVICNTPGLLKAEVIWKLEGPTDVLAWLSLPNRPDGQVAITNAMGAKERPQKWICNLAAGKLARVLHDADRPGQDGARGWDEHGRRRLGWCAGFAEAASEVRNVSLPFDIAPDHGKDFRDWVMVGNGWPELLKLAEASLVFEPSAGNPIQVIEADDDPHRLARVNLEQYSTATGGRTLRYWRGEWYTWRHDRYRKIDAEELRAKVVAVIKQEFDRINLDDQAHSDGDPQPARKVTKSLVSNVIEATAGMVVLSSSIDLMTWLPTKERRNLIAMRNGLFDVDAYLSGDDERMLLPHSPDWFSTIALPYGFDRNAECPKWGAFLERNLEMDPGRIKLLQEWAGYLLLPDTGQQKFLILEGEGANGKSVFCAGVAAMLGVDNCSFVPLECFGDRFSKTSTLGRLVNISADAGELDKVAEGFIKSFTSGDPMMFDRKMLTPLECVPTARLMVACNQRPRFTDRSDGIWRRMILVPWWMQVPKEEQVRNMDKIWWWLEEGQLPGIFNWALAGLGRLRSQNGFTRSGVVDQAVEDYRAEMNPAKVFLSENVEKAAEGVIRTQLLYSAYTRWVKENGYRPLSEAHFGKEVKRRFHSVEKKRGGERGDRFWYYQGIRFLQDEICGVSTRDELF